ncbi:reverse transcriptase domain-containing protein [Tanacetum coccineum]
MHTHASKPLPETERTLNRRLRRRNRIVPFDQRNNRPQNPRIVYSPILDINHFRHFLVILENFYPMDDEPMWAADRVVAPTPGLAITIPDTANEFSIKGNYLTLVKGNQFDGRIKTDPHKHIHEFLRNCDMFKYRDTENEAARLMIQYYQNLLSRSQQLTQEVLNSAASGIFLYKTPNQAYQLLEDKVLLKLDWAKNKKTKSSLKKTVAFADEGSSNSDTDKIMARMDATTLKMDAQYKELQSRAKKTTPDLDEDDMLMSCEEEAKLADKQSGRTFGSLPSNTQPNPKGHNSKAYQPPQSRNEHVNVVFRRSGKSYDPRVNPNNQQNNTEDPINFDSDDKDEEPTPQPKTQPTKPVKQTLLPKPYKQKIPYPQRLRKEKMEAQYGKFLDMIRVVRINVPLVDVLARMPNYGKFLKELISNKHKIEQISTALLSDESLAMIQNKFSPKLGDPRSFLIPCNFNKTFSYNALADLGASINLMPYSLYAKLSLETLKPTKMSVRLANRSFQYPIGIAENMLVEVDKFTFLANFVILEME